MRASCAAEGWAGDPGGPGAAAEGTSPGAGAGSPKNSSPNSSADKSDAVHLPGLLCAAVSDFGSHFRGGCARPRRSTASQRASDRTNSTSYLMNARLAGARAGLPLLPHIVLLHALVDGLDHLARTLAAAGGGGGRAAAPRDHVDLLALVRGRALHRAEQLLRRDRLARLVVLQRLDAREHALQLALHAHLPAAARLEDLADRAVLQLVQLGLVALHQLLGHRQLVVAVLLLVLLEPRREVAVVEGAAVVGAVEQRHARALVDQQRPHGLHLGDGVLVARQLHLDGVPDPFHRVGVGDCGNDGEARFLLGGLLLLGVPVLLFPCGLPRLKLQVHRVGVGIAGIGVALVQDGVRAHGVNGVSSDLLVTPFLKFIDVVALECAQTEQVRLVAQNHRAARHRLLVLHQRPALLALGPALLLPQTIGDLELLPAQNVLLADTGDVSLTVGTADDTALTLNVLRGLAPFGGREEFTVQLLAPLEQLLQVGAASHLEVGAEQPYLLGGQGAGGDGLEQRGVLRRRRLVKASTRLEDKPVSRNEQLRGVVRSQELQHAALPEVVALLVALPVHLLAVPQKLAQRSRLHGLSLLVSIRRCSLRNEDVLAVEELGVEGLERLEPDADREDLRGDVATAGRFSDLDAIEALAEHPY
ncbi:uncharacterized protein BcabD6B2_05660 [Babesia caballi]|uniref:Uncharacterized protein n=1 Tax=Babesia caballi TaxID=5871 RepID=A0AAV4LMR5_BABCB|nr:hypothetical protein BcabD6B2_05660 [Babesia caballi]